MDVNIGECGGGEEGKVLLNEKMGGGGGEKGVDLEQIFSPRNFAKSDSIYKLVTRSRI